MIESRAGHLPDPIDGGGEAVLRSLGIWPRGLAASLNDPINPLATRWSSANTLRITTNDQEDDNSYVNNVYRSWFLFRMARPKGLMANVRACEEELQNQQTVRRRMYYNVSKIYIMTWEVSLYMCTAKLSQWGFRAWHSIVESVEEKGNKVSHRLPQAWRNCLESSTSSKTKRTEGRSSMNYQRVSCNWCIYLQTWIS